MRKGKWRKAALSALRHRDILFFTAKCKIDFFLDALKKKKKKKTSSLYLSLLIRRQRKLKQTPQTMDSPVSLKHLPFSAVKVKKKNNPPKKKPQKNKNPNQKTLIEGVN